MVKEDMCKLQKCLSSTSPHIHKNLIHHLLPFLLRMEWIEGEEEVRVW